MVGVTVANPDDMTLYETTLHKMSNSYHTSYSQGEPRKPGNQGKVREKRKIQGKCVLAYGQLPRVLILSQNVQKRNYLLCTVVHYMKSERSKGFSYMQVVT